MGNLKESCLEMFDFLHDVITDINQENENWHNLFNEEYDKLRTQIEEAI